MFVHGLWLPPSGWDRWAELFEANGFVALTSGCPDDPDTVEEAMAHPEVFAHKTVGEVADHFQTIIGGLDTKPRSSRVTEIVELTCRGHALIIDAAGARSPTPPWPSSSASPAHRLLGCRSRHSVATA